MDENELLGQVADLAQAEARVEVSEKTNIEDISSKDDTEVVGDDQDFSRTPWDERKPEVEEDESEPSKTETETNTETNTSEETPAPVQEPETPKEEENLDAWKSTLPQAPAEFNLAAPSFDDDGNLENMTGQQFLEYTANYAAYRTQVENYNNTVLNTMLNAAEEILPEIKTNPTVRALVQNQMIAQTAQGNNYTVVDAARELKGLLQGERATGAQNAKSSITIQKNAALETPTNQRKSDTTKADKLAKRLKSGDTSAQEELMYLWLEEGKI